MLQRRISVAFSGLDSVNPGLMRYIRSPGQLPHFSFATFLPWRTRVSSLLNNSSHYQLFQNLFSLNPSIIERLSLHLAKYAIAAVSAFCWFSSGHSTVTKNSPLWLLKSRIACFSLRYYVTSSLLTIWRWLHIKPLYLAKR